jgi:hypothetical protein
MKLLAVLLMLTLGSWAQARTFTFSCVTHDWDIVFSTSVDDKAVEVRRAYEYSPTLIIYLRIPLTGPSPRAAIQVSDDGRIYNDTAICDMVEQ